MPGRRSSTRLSLLLALFCAAALPASAQVAVPPRTQQPVMPNVVGSTVAEAMGRLAQMGMQAQVREMESQEARGTVVRQSPSAGTAVRQGMVAVLGVSTGPARTPNDPPANPDGQAQPADGERGGIDVGVRPGLVPDVTGMSLTMARIRLVASGLRAGAVDSGSVDGARPGRVIAQDPLPGTQAIPGRSVRLTLQRRAPVAPQPPVDPPPTRPDPPPPPVSTLVTVPDLSGRTVVEARTIVGGARLLLGGVDSTTSSGRPGTVVGQRPAAGESVEAGTLVTITVARQALVVVPRLTGRSPTDARRELTRVGLRPGSLTEREAPGQPTVTQQSVPAGSRVAPGTVVNLVVSRAPVARPDTPVVAVTPPAPPPAQPPVVDSAAPAVEPATPGDPVATQPPAAVAPTPAPPAVTAPAQPAATPATPAQREPAAVTTLRWDLLAIIAALLLAIAGGLYWRSRVARRVVPREIAPAAASPVIPTVTIRTASGGSHAGSQPETPVNDGRVKVGVIFGAARAPAPEPGAAALQPARVGVRMVEDETEDALGAHPERVTAAAPMRVRVAAAEPRLVRDEGAVILRRSS